MKWTALSISIFFSLSFSFSSNDIFKTSTTVNLAKSGLSLFQDILGGKNVQDSLSVRYEQDLIIRKVRKKLKFDNYFSALEALDHLSVGDITRIAIEGAKDLQNGKSLESIIASRWAITTWFNISAVDSFKITSLQTSHVNKPLFNTIFSGKKAIDKYAGKDAVDFIGHDNVQNALDGWEKPKCSIRIDKFYWYKTFHS